MEDEHSQVDEVQASQKAPMVCKECFAHGLLNKAGHVSAHSDVAAKRQQRDLFLEAVRECGVKNPVVLIVDHFLPHGDGGSYLSDELLRLPNMAAERIFTCNVDNTVVRDLQARGIVLAVNLCLCLYVQRMAYLIRQCGGLVAAFVDVCPGEWSRDQNAPRHRGGFEHGASRPMTLLSQLRLFHSKARDGALLLCAASDLPERFKGQDSLYTKEMIGLPCEPNSLQERPPLVYNHMDRLFYKYYEVRSVSWATVMCVRYGTMQPDNPVSGGPGLSDSTCTLAAFWRATVGTQQSGSESRKQNLRTQTPL